MRRLLNRATAVILAVALAIVGFIVTVAVPGLGLIAGIVLFAGAALAVVWAFAATEEVLHDRHVAKSEARKRRREPSA